MKKIIVANHKMELTYDEANALKEKMITINFDKINLIVCPSNINLSIYKNEYSIGAQNCHYEQSGPFTGEVSAYQLKLIGCQYVIIGHASRREFETDEEIRKKIKAALDVALIPILCIGETKIQKDLNKVAETIKRQLHIALKGLTEEEMDELIISYEPIWAIGTNLAMKPDKIAEIVLYIKKTISEISYSNKYKIIYGGSVNENTINEIIKAKGVDGVLIGSASVDCKSLQKLIESIS